MAIVGMIPTGCAVCDVVCIDESNVIRPCPSTNFYKHQHIFYAHFVHLGTKLSIYHKGQRCSDVCVCMCVVVELQHAPDGPRPAHPSLPHLILHYLIHDIPHIYLPSTHAPNTQSIVVIQHQPQPQ